jgi:hypothetical protein
VNAIRLPIWILLAAFVCAVGCTTRKPTSDPLAGWHICRPQNPSRFNKAITDDYKDYIQKLPAEERFRVRDSNIWFLEDGTGQYAVNVQIPLNGTWWQHVLIYDKDNKRVKTIKYASGGYRS